MAMVLSHIPKYICHINQGCNEAFKAFYFPKLI